MNYIFILQLLSPFIKMKKFMLLLSISTREDKDIPRNFYSVLQI